MSAGNNDGGWKRFYSNAVHCPIDGRNTRIRFRVKEDPNASDLIAFCEFHSFLVKVQTNAGYIHAMHAMHV